MSATWRAVECLVQSEWDAAVWQNRRGNVFCSWMWGEYKRRVGWHVTRLFIVDPAGERVAILGYQTRRKGFARFVYIQGGPLFTERGEREAERVVAFLVEHLALGPFDLVGINYEHFGSGAGVLALLAQGFAPVVSSRNYTMEVDLTQAPEAIVNGMNRRWRKSLKRAERREDLSVTFVTDPAERLASFDAFGRMYAALKRRKGFRTEFDTAAFRDLVAHDPRHLLVEARDAGQVVLVIIAHLSAERCTNFFAAASEKAGVLGATSLAIWRIIQHARALNCRVLDVGGIDPAGNRGVYDFKRGLTRNVVQSGPLWLYGRSRLLRGLTGAYLAFR